MLNGVGGRTIAEAQSVIGYTEFHKWMSYRQKRGSFNQGLRIERAGALIATLLKNQNLAKGNQPVSFYDLAPHHDEPELSMEEAMEKWK